MRIAPGGASSGALAVVASPFAFHADAVAALLLHFAAGWIQLPSVLALALRLENAITIFIANVIVFALASSSARFRIRTDQVLFESVAFRLAFLLKAVGPLFVGFTFRPLRLTLEVRTDASAFSPNSLFVLLVHDFSLLEVFAVGMAAAVWNRDAVAVVVSDFAIGTGAALGADGLAIFVTQRDGATRSLAVIRALLEHLAWGTFDFASIHVRSPIADSVTFAFTSVCVTPQIVADTLHLVGRIVAEAMIGDAIAEVGTNWHDFVALGEDFAVQDLAGGGGGRECWVDALGRLRNRVTILQTPFVSEARRISLDVALRSQKVVLLFLVVCTTQTFRFMKEGRRNDDFKGHFAVPLDGDTLVWNVQLLPNGTGRMIVNIGIAEFLHFLRSFVA